MVSPAGCKDDHQLSNVQVFPETVTFEVTEGDRGPKAVNVSKEEGGAPAEEAPEAAAEEVAEEAPAEEAPEEEKKE